MLDRITSQTGIDTLIDTGDEYESIMMDTGDNDEDVMKEEELWFTK